MNAIPRQTLAADATVEGIGLFTGRPVRCTIKPAESGGIVFIRVDLDGQPKIPALLAALSAEPVHPVFAQIPPRNTAVASDGGAVFTTEHVLAALAGLGVTDALIELDAPEVPIGDGSAEMFTSAIKSAGLAELDDPIEPLVVTEPISVASPDGSAEITAEPVGAEEPASYRYNLDYGPDAPIAAQHAEWAIDPESFASEIAPARTFSLAAEAEQMRALGMFGSFTPRDLLVIDDAGNPIDNAWRFDNEPARHKLLDLVGDLALVGRPIRGRITSTRGGHALNHAMARALLGG